MKTLLSTLFLFLSVSAFAGDFTYFGFAQQSIVKTTNGVNISGNSSSEFGSAKRSEFGLGAGYSHNQNLDARLLVTSHIDGERDDGTPKIALAFVDLHTDRSENNVGIRVGRVPYAHGLYNSSRNLPYARDLELPPQGPYRDGTRYMLRSGDGCQLYTNLNITPSVDAYLTFTSIKLINDAQDDLINNFIAPSNGSEFAEFKRSSHLKSVAATVHLYDIRTLIKVDMQELDIRADIKNLPLPEYRTVLKANHAGFRKYYENWDITYEYAWGTSESNYPLTPPGYVVGHQYNHSLHFRFNLPKDYMLILGYSEGHLNSKDRDGRLISKMTAGTVPASVTYTTDYVIALNKTINKNVNAKLEMHRMTGTANLNPKENNYRDGDLASKYNVYIFSIGYNF